MQSQNDLIMLYMDCQHVVDSVSYLETAIYVPTDKSHQYFTLISVHIFFCNLNTFYACFGSVIDVDVID